MTKSFQQATEKKPSRKAHTFASRARQPHRPKLAKECAFCQRRTTQNGQTQRPRERRAAPNRVGSR